MHRNLGANDEQFRNIEFRDRIRRRDRGAWDQLYRSYASRLEAVARGTLPARLDPESAAQQTWIQALSKAPRFARKHGSSENPYPWLCSICINYCISVLRKDKVGRRPRVENSLVQRARMRPPLGLLVGEGAVHEAFHGEEEQEAELRPGFTRGELRREIASLPRRLQRVVYLRFSCDLPNATIAELLRINVGAVRQRLCRAYAILREAMSKGELE